MKVQGDIVERPKAQNRLLKRLGVEKALTKAGFKTTIEADLLKRFSCDLIARLYWEEERRRSGWFSRLFLFQESFTCKVRYGKFADYDDGIIPDRCCANVSRATKLGLPYFYVAYPERDGPPGCKGYGRCSVPDIRSVDTKFREMFGKGKPELQRADIIIIGSMVDYYYPYGTMWEIDSFVSTTFEKQYEEVNIK